MPRSVSSGRSACARAMCEFACAHFACACVCVFLQSLDSQRLWNIKHVRALAIVEVSNCMHYPVPSRSYYI
eukprot:1148073-Pelagomonas_calceolata.AAC.14